jgi:hypothetical protein
MGLHGGTLNIATIFIIVVFIRAGIMVTMVAVVFVVERILSDREVWQVGISSVCFYIYINQFMG